LSFSNSVLIQWGKWTNVATVTLPTAYSEYYIIISYVNTTASDTGNALTQYGYSKMNTISTMTVFKPSSKYHCRYITIGY